MLDPLRLDLPEGEPREAMLTLITALTLIVFGALLGAGGTWLAVLGGSWAYVVAGLALVACGVLLVRRRRVALSLYAALLVAVAASNWTRTSLPTGCSA